MRVGDLTHESSVSYFTMDLEPINPKPFLQSITGQTVLIKLKWGTEYKGFLVSTDNYMNVQLMNAEEYVDGNFTGNLGEVLIRCNNILYVKEIPQDDADENLVDMTESS